MTPEEFRKAMQECADLPGDEETTHGAADDLMCTLLRELGYGEGVDIFENMPKWYA